LFHDRRNVLDADDGAALLTELAEQIVIRGVYPQRDLRPIVG
jgi:hypothetical protein